MKPLVLSADDLELAAWMRDQGLTEDDIELVTSPDDLDDLVFGERLIVVLPAFKLKPDVVDYAAKLAEAIRRDVVS